MPAFSQKFSKLLANLKKSRKCGALFFNTQLANSISVHRISLLALREAYGGLLALREAYGAATFLRVCCLAVVAEHAIFFWQACPAACRPLQRHAGAHAAAVCAATQNLHHWL